MSSASKEADVRARKQLLRKAVRAKLKALTDDELQTQSERVWQRLFAMEEYQTAKSIGLFLSMPKGEIRTEMAIADASKAGKAIYVPEVGKNFEQADMDLLKVPIHANSEELFYHHWPRNKWGIPEPPPNLELPAAAPGDIDLIIVPGLAFDHQGDRLGQGKGYYDRFIARMCAGAHAPRLIAVGLECQLVDEHIPTNDYDRRMDMVLLPHLVIKN